MTIHDVTGRMRWTQRTWSLLARALTVAVRCLRSYLWQVITLGLVIIILILFVRPFGTGPDLTADDVATAWNKNIGRLGILPVYPPTEDIHVGDLWGVVADADDVPLLGTAVRLAHIDLRPEISADQKGPIFAETAEIKQGETFRHQANDEVERPLGNKIFTSIAAFPGITITHAARSNVSAGSRLGIFGAATEVSDEEEIQIPVAETHGASSIDTLGKLSVFCVDPQTKAICTDGYVRSLLAYSVGERILAVKEGRYVTRLQLRLVTRVYATREVRQKRVRRDQRSGDIAIPTVTTPSEVTSDAHAPPENSATPVTGGRPRALAVRRGDETQIQLTQVFQRPIVFGYRALTVSLAPSTPAKEPIK